MSPLSSNQLTLIPESYKRTNNVTPQGKELIILKATIFNYSKDPFLLDFDHMFLIDDRESENRVEFVSGIKHDENGKILWNIPPVSKFEKRLEFIIDDHAEVSELKLFDEKIKLSSIPIR